MAVQDPVLINGWWVYLRDSMGSTHLNPSDKQIHNARVFRNQMLGYGWSELAIAGMLGNIQHESSLTTGAIEKPSVLPNSGQTLADVPNSVMITTYFDPNNHNTRGYGIGLIQWDSYTDQAIPNGPALVSYAIRNNKDWYDGNVQTSRLEYEYQHDSTGGNIPVPATGRTYNWWTVHQWQGQQWTYAMFKTASNITPSLSADIFRAGRERGGEGSIQIRRDNAEYWYQYFIDHPHQTKPWMFFNKRKVTFDVKRVI